jgi:hypothetical protein
MVEQAEAFGGNTLEVTELEYEPEEETGENLAHRGIEP